MPSRKSSERPIRVEHRRHDSTRYDKTPTRAYASIDTAAPGAIRWARESGKARDLFVVYHNLTGLEIGRVYVAINGSLLLSSIVDS